LAAALRVGFAGTPPFAATALAAILDAGFLVVQVLTRPDRPRGRGLKLLPSAVKSLALERGLALFQPTTLNDQAARAELAGAALDVLVVAAYGLILPQPVLEESLSVSGILLGKTMGRSPELADRFSAESGRLADLEVRTGGEQLGAAPQAGGADLGALGHVLERGAGADPARLAGGRCADGNQHHADGCRARYRRDYLGARGIH